MGQYDKYFSTPVAAATQGTATVATPNSFDKYFSPGYKASENPPVAPITKPGILDTIKNFLSSAVSSSNKSQEDIYQAQQPKQPLIAPIGEGLQKGSVLQPGPTNALANLPKGEPVNFSLNPKQQKLSQSANASFTVANAVTKAKDSLAITAQEQAKRPADFNPFYAPLMASSVFLGPEFIAAPLATGAKLALFTGLEKVQNKLDLHLSNLVPSSFGDSSKQVADILQMAGNGLLSHGVYESAPAVADAFTKDLIVKYNLPSQVFIPAETIADIFKTGTKATPEQLDQFVKITGGNREMINQAIQNGLDVSVPAQQVTQLVDKPYWAKIKAALKLAPTDETRVVNLGEMAQAPKALIENKTNPVFDKYFSTTPEIPAKTAPTMALEAPKVETPTAQANTPETALTQEAQKYKSAEEFVKAQQPNTKPLSLNTKEVAIKDLNAHGAPELKDAIRNVGNGATSKTNGAIEITQRPTGELIVLDGQHRVIEAMNKGESKVKVKVIPYDEAINPEFGYTVANLVKDGDPVPFKTKSQLTDIWNKATKGEQPTVPEKGTITQPKAEPTEIKVARSQVPVGEGETKVSRLEARVKDSLDNISQETIDKLGLSTYEQMNKKDTIAAASKYVTENPDEALKVLTGEKEVPKGLLRNSIYVAMQNDATGNVDLARKLASISSTRLGQELSILTEIDPNSPVKIMSDVVKFREAKFTEKGKSVRQAKNDTVNEIQKEIKKVAPKKEDWQSFIESIVC